MGCIQGIKPCPQESQSCVPSLHQMHHMRLAGFEPTLIAWKAIVLAINTIDALFFNQDHTLKASNPLIFETIALYSINLNIFQVFNEMARIISYKQADGLIDSVSDGLLSSDSSFGVYKVKS